MPSIWGDIVVWKEDVSSLLNDIYGYNMSSGEYFLVCNSSNRDSPQIWGDVVVWTRWQSSDADVCGCRLSTGEEFEVVAINSSYQYFPALTGNTYTVAWQDLRNSNWDIYGATLVFPTPTPSPSATPTATLNIINTSVNLSSVTIYDPEERTSHPCAGMDTYVYLTIGEDAVRIDGPWISSGDGVDTASLFYLENESIEILDDGFWVTVNPQLAYNVSARDFENEVNLAQVLLGMGNGTINSTFIFAAVGDGVAHDLTITALVNGSSIRSTTPVTIEARDASDCMPDLNVWDKWEEWVVPNVSYIVHYEIGNSGGANASAGHNASLYVEGSLVETQEVSVNLSPWSSYIGQFNTTVNWSGPYDNVTVCADEFDEVMEWYEGNNCAYNTWPPQPTPTPSPSATPTPTPSVTPTATATPELPDPVCVFVNWGFESGNFSGWTNVTGNVSGPNFSELTPWNVTTGGDGFFGDGYPLEGTFFAQNGFDGSAGLFYDIYQEVAIPATANTAVLFWHDRIQWDLVFEGNPMLPRTYNVTLQPSGGGVPLATLFNMSLHPYTWSSPANYSRHGVDLLSVAPGINGTTVRVNWHEFIPEDYTGPAQFDLDFVCLQFNVTAPTPTPTLTPLLPDLTITDISPDPIHGFVNWPINFSLIFKNRGNNNSSGFYLDVYGDLPFPPDPGDVGDDYIWVNSMNDSDILTTGFPWLIINYSFPGNYSLWAQIDTDRDVNESREWNNIYGPVAVIIDPLPDLEVWDKWEEWVVPNVSYIVHYVIGNDGDVNASAGHNASLYVDGGFVETQVVPVNLTPGDWYTGQFNTTVNWSGPYDIVTVCADEFDEVMEEWEIYNCWNNTWPPVLPTPTPEPTWTPPSGGGRGGGGGGGGGGALPGLMVDAVDRTGSCSMDSDGIVGEDFEVTSRDGCVVIRLSEGTEALDSEGYRLRYIDVTPVEPLPDPPEGHYVLAAFDFKPDGTTFSQALEATLCFDPGDIPDGMSAENIVIAVLDEETGEWSFIGGTVDTENNTITFDLNHFTIYGVLAAPAAPTATPTSTTTPEPTVTPPPDEGGGLSTGALIGISIGAGAILGLIAGSLIAWRRRAARRTTE